jgi:ABC-type protease/lipase transport system fused ATPase/permease subunit
VLAIEGLVIASPGEDRPLLPKFNLALKGGSIVLVLGASGTGKTSLLQTLTGVWPAKDGVVRLGGRDLHRWAAEDRGCHVGFAPQDAELLPGTIAENICRFNGASSEDVVAATQIAGFHDMVVRLADGYDTAIGHQGAYLSRGQKQAISLSRALFGNPVLICLDEPSANLDQIAAEQLKRSLVVARSRGAVVLAATHDMRLLACADQILLLSAGSIQIVSAADYMATLQPARVTAARSDGAGA